MASARCAPASNPVPMAHPVVENKAMSVREFRDDDVGYLAWIAAHPDGHVINIARNYYVTAARVHHADCWTINRQTASGSAWTDQYVKVCAEHVAELDKWASDRVGESIPRCGICHPAQHVARPVAAKPAEQAVAPPVPDGRSKIQRPTADSPVVRAWADDYIRFQGRPPWQEQLRTVIRALCEQLKPSEEVLHATFFGAKRPNADIENLVLYNIGSFAIACRNGIRFEHGGTVPVAPGGDEYPFCYRYALVPRSGTFDHWQHGRELWRRSTGPIWARSPVTRSWHRSGWRWPAARPRCASRRARPRRHSPSESRSGRRTGFSRRGADW
jgi:hypothetical protein